MRAVLLGVVLSFVISCGGAAAPPAPVVKPAPTPEVEPAPTGPVIPDSPAGVTFRAWLDAFNAGDEPGLAAFVSTYKPPHPLQAWLQFRAMTGGVDVVSIAPLDPRSLRFVVKEKSSPTEALGWLKLKDADPPELEAFDLFAIPPGASADQIGFDLDDATRARVVEVAAARLIEGYVYAEVAEQMAQAIRAHHASGDWMTSLHQRYVAAAPTPDW